MGLIRNVCEHNHVMDLIFGAYFYIINFFFFPFSDSCSTRYSGGCCSHGSNEDEEADRHDGDGEEEPKLKQENYEVNDIVNIVSKYDWR